MIVCICAGVDDRELQEHIEGGARSLADLERKCGAGGDCGSCRDMLCDALEDAAADRCCPPPAAFRLPTAA
jgi:bacterioferritin-associated ferredoxin